jgi:DNA topoisomerase-1
VTDAPTDDLLAADRAEAAAEAAGLRYVTDDEPCITRRRRGRGWEYTDADGERITDAAERERIEAIAIPPAWTDVWICPRADGHILATGRDDKGRKQYRYHPDWRTHRDAEKFDRLYEFGSALPTIRRTADSDLRRRTLTREKVLALVVVLLDRTLIRVGNDVYAAENDSYGLTTLRSEHVDVDGSLIRLSFDAKGGAEHEAALRDARLARVVAQCDDLDGTDLFAYEDDEGQAVDVDSTDVNDYLREVTGEDITAKDFRKWGASVAALTDLVELGPVEEDRDGADGERDTNVLHAMDAAAERLDDTREIARGSYVHPRIAEAYKEGTLHEVWASVRTGRDLDRPERALLALLTDQA